jgi:hypothetical protein
MPRILLQFSNWNSIAERIPPPHERRETTLPVASAMQHSRQCSFERGAKFTANAVKMQAWVALPVYVQVAIADKQLGLDLSLCEIFADSWRDRFRENRYFRSVFQTKGGEILNVESRIKLILLDL